ncbi:MAG: type II secretion system F family protein [Polyangiaceae bacterium]
MNIPYPVLRYAVMVMLCLALAAAMYAMASAPTREANRFGMRGLKRQRAIDESDGWARLEPLVRWLGVRLSGIVPQETRRNIDRHLALAGDWLGISAEEFLGLTIVSFFGGLGFGVIFGVLTDMGALMVMIIGPVGAAVPYLQMQSIAQERLRSINRGLPYAIDLIALAMSAGKDFPGALRQVVEKSSNQRDGLVEEFGRILQELQIGKTRRQAMLDLAERVPSESVMEFVNSVVQAEEKGNPLADVLQVQAGMTRMRRSVNAEKSAAKAGVAMVGPLVLLMACVMILILAPIFMKLGETGNV